MRSRLSSPAMVTSKLGMVMQTLDFRPRTSDVGRQTSDLTPRHSDQRDLNASLLQCSKIGFGHAAVGDHFLQSDGGAIRDRLRRPNLLESQTATVFLATSTITRLTFASSRLGVLSP